MAERSLLRRLKRRFSKKTAPSAYEVVQESLFFLQVAKAFAWAFKARLGKGPISTGFVDPGLFQYSEELFSLGFAGKNPKHTFFGGDLKDIKYPYNPIEEVDRHDFDLVLGPGHTDLKHFAEKISASLKKISDQNFQTSLNMEKVLVVAALVCLMPDRSSILELGAKECGTSIFIAELSKELGKQVEVFACDTFEKGVLLKVKEQRLEENIHLVEGDIEKILPRFDRKKFSLMLIDTDQYKQVKGALDLIKMPKSPLPDVLINGLGQSSVNLAVSEFFNTKTKYTRESMTKHFDYLVPPATSSRVNCEV